MATKRQRTSSLPEDKYSSGNSDYQCGAELYGETKEQADIKKRKYYSCYPIQGYGTRVAYEGWVHPKDGERYYYIKMARWHSCD